MSNYDNELRISGNLTRDPELRYTQSGKPVASFTVAVSGRVEPKEYDSNGVKVRGFELIADDVSVSLRRQQATVKKTTPSPSGQGNGYNSYSPNAQYTTDPYATGAPF